MPKSARPWQRLTELAISLEAAAMREPYPRLAEVMQALANPQPVAKAVRSARAA